MSSLITRNGRVQYAADGYYEYILEEPGWHGWARWEVDRYFPIGEGCGSYRYEVVKRGWVRRKRGAPLIIASDLSSSPRDEAAVREERIRKLKEAGL